MTSDHCQPRSGPKLALSKLDLEEVAGALADQTDYEHRWLIDPETGEILYWTTRRRRGWRDAGRSRRARRGPDRPRTVLRPVPGHGRLRRRDQRRASWPRTGGARSRAGARSVDSRTTCRRTSRASCRSGTPSATSVPNVARSSGSSTTRKSATPRPEAFLPTSRIPTCPELCCRRQKDPPRFEGKLTPETARGRKGSAASWVDGPSRRARFCRSS
jgi:hypothetical protein